MKRQILFSLIAALMFATISQVHAVVMGDNVSQPRIGMFSGGGGESSGGQLIPGGASEIFAGNYSRTLALGTNGYYRNTYKDQPAYILYTTNVMVTYPWFVFTTPDVFLADGWNLAPGYSYDNNGNNGSDNDMNNGGIAAANGIQYLVQGKGFRVRNTTTNALVGKFTFRVVNFATKLVVWSKTWVDSATTVDVRSSEVTDIDGDGHDDVVVVRQWRATPTTVKKYLDVYNLATGVLKKSLTWNQIESW